MLKEPQLPLLLLSLPASSPPPPFLSSPHTPFALWHPTSFPNQLLWVLAGRKKRHRSPTGERGDLIIGFVWLPLQVTSAIPEIWSQLQAATALGGTPTDMHLSHPLAFSSSALSPGLGSYKLIVTLEQCHDLVY